MAVDLLVEAQVLIPICSNCTQDTVRFPRLSLMSHQKADCACYELYWWRPAPQGWLAGLFGHVRGGGVRGIIRLRMNQERSREEA
jgi:hypothetical protein